MPRLSRSARRNLAQPHARENTTAEALRPLPRERPAWKGIPASGLSPRTRACRVIRRTPRGFSKLLDVRGARICASPVTAISKAAWRGCRSSRTAHSMRDARSATTRTARQSPNSTTQPGGAAAVHRLCHAQSCTAAAAGAKVKHSIVASGRSCMNCHTPHGQRCGEADQRRAGERLP
jgi:hypothetical protein